MFAAAGFIILRHVTDELTNRYWIHSYHCVRRFYPEAPIVIVDDNSKAEFVATLPLYKTKIVQGEYPGRGELLPYYYYLKNKWFDVAVILHDSVFMNARIDFTVNNYRMLWEFEHSWDQTEAEEKMIDVLNNSAELREFHANKSLWKGCFGCMSIIRHDFLVYLDNKYDLGRLLDCVLARYDRCSLERVLACMLQREGGRMPSVFGDIHQYCAWGFPFSEIKNNRHLPAIKCWTGR